MAKPDKSLFHPEDIRTLNPGSELTIKKKKTWKDVKSVAAAKNAGLKHYMGADGKKKLAITKEELNRQPGETLTQAYNRVEGKTPRKTAAKPSAKTDAKTDAKKTDKKGRPLILGKGAKIRPFGGAIARALLGEDEKFGGDRGAIDFIRRRKPKKKKMGGEVKKYRGGGFAKQGANARLDESLGERRGKESTKSQSMKSRRNESRGARKPSRPQSAGAAKRGWGAAIR